MTLKELSQLYYLNREIEIDKERLKGLREQLSGGSRGMDAMPKATGTDSKMERYMAEIIDLEKIIQAKMVRCIQERNRLERYIAEIPDSLTRQIFTLRFVNGLSWVRIALKIGGNFTADGVRMACNRYIKKFNKQNN